MGLKYPFLILFSVTIFQCAYGRNLDRKYSCVDCKSIYKCCPAYSYFVDTKCQIGNTSISKNFSHVKIYDVNLRNSSKSFDDVFVTHVSATFDESTFLNLDLNYYLVEDGGLHVVSNATGTKKVFYEEEFCIEYALYYPYDNEPETTFWLFNPKETHLIEYLRMLGLLISSVFFAITLIIYGLLEKHKTLAGKITMAMLMSLLAGFSLLATQFIYVITEYKPNVEFCLITTTCLYFLFLSSFCWMNVWSYDLWRCIKSFEAPATGSQNLRFLVYGLYGWGVPIVLSIMLVVINQTDNRAVIKPLGNGCFLQGYKKFIYLYVPMLIITLLSWLFFFITVYTLWRNGTDNMGTSTTTLKDRMKLYFKLSLLMGLNWIFEVMTYPYPESEYVVDLYNMLIGVAIFVTLIWKKNMRSDIRERFKKRNH